MNKINLSQPINIVVGLGCSGIGAARLLHSEGKQVLVFEKKTCSELAAKSKQLEQEGIFVELGQDLDISNFKRFLPHLSSVVVSPGIPWDHSTLNELRRLGVKVQGEISLAWESLKHLAWIGITGTNGKTTVTHMLKHVLQSNGLVIPAGGNVGKSATEIALLYKKSKNKLPKWVIMELSSYQLESEPGIAPYIGIWTTLTPDHLERHRSIDNYANIKRRLLENASIRIYNGDDKFLSSKRSILGKGLWVSTKGSKHSADFWINSHGKVIEGNSELFDSSILQVSGNHNLQNMLIVTAAARKIGLSPKSIEKGITTFKGVPHRLEMIGTINNLEVFNDSKATNYDSAEIGLDAVPSPSVVIGGGKAKKGDHSKWGEKLSQKACALILFGESALEIQSLLSSSGFNLEIYLYKDLEEAVNKAIKIASLKRGRSILFSPACSSFDQYKNFEERGEHFKELVRPFLDTPTEVLGNS